VQTISRLRDRAVVSTVAHPGIRVWMDVAGAVIVGLLALVSVVVASSTGTDARNFLLLLGAAVAVVLVSAGIGSRTHRVFVPLALALWGTWLAYRWRLDLPAGPLKGPFGYRNANGAFLAVVATAWLMAGVAIRRIVVVLTAVPAAILSVVAVENATGASAVAIAWVALISLVGSRVARTAIVVCGAILGGVLVATVALGVTYQPSIGATGLGSVVANTGLTERRLALWHDSWTIMAEHPLGAGIDSFRVLSPTALADPDAFHSHNEFLERGVEFGIAGSLLMVALFIWMFARLHRVPFADAVTALGAAAVAVLGIHGCVDYVMHTPQVVLIGAALFGTALVPPREREEA
jgi:O-antigen ligase